MRRGSAFLLMCACTSPAPVKVEEAPAPVKAAKAEIVEAPRTEKSATKPEPSSEALLEFLGRAPVEVAVLTDAAAIAGYVEKASAVPGVSRALVNPSSSEAFSLEFNPPIDAAEVARRFKWEKPYAASSDEHLLVFGIVLFSGAVADRHNKRIATALPKFGEFTVDAKLTARPGGEPPRLVTGASPAYDLALYSGKVDAINFTRERK